MRRFRFFRPVVVSRNAIVSDPSTVYTGCTRSTQNDCHDDGWSYSRYIRCMRHEVFPVSFVYNIIYARRVVKSHAAKDGEIFCFFFITREKKKTRHLQSVKSKTIGKLDDFFSTRRDVQTWLFLTASPVTARLYINNIIYFDYNIYIILWWPYCTYFCEPDGRRLRSAHQCVYCIYTCFFFSKSLTVVVTSHLKHRHVRTYTEELFVLKIISGWKLILSRACSLTFFFFFFVRFFLLLLFSRFMQVYI